MTAITSAAASCIAAIAMHPWVPAATTTTADITTATYSD